MIETGKQLAESIFGWEVVSRDWAGYEHGIELRTGAHVVGFVGLTTRTITVDDKPLTVAGIGFVCVEDFWRGMGIATSLMQAAHFKAKHQLPFALLNAGHPEIYKRMGYHHPENLPLGWWMCELGEQRWPDGEVDLRGTW